MKDIIFISHATPEDNDFTIWLASRLELLGYKVWIDKNELVGGETFWSDIENVIKNNAIKFLLVYSENICDKADGNKIKNGIQKEISFAQRVINENPNLTDFFIILHIDNSPYDLFPGSKDLNQIPFNENWADGLSLLVKKLKKDNVLEYHNTLVDDSAKWYLDNYIIKNPVIKKKELYYTNWWNIGSLPKSFFIIRFTNEKQAIAIHKNNEEQLVIINANCLITFNNNLNFEVTDDFGKNKIQPANLFEIKVSELVLGYQKDTFPSFKDAENYFKKLLKRALHLYFRERQLCWYELSNKKNGYYHTPVSLPKLKVSFSYPSQLQCKTKTKNLLGKYLLVGKWHYAISIKPSIHPFLGFHLKSHIVFTSNGFKTLDDKELQHSYRRKKGKRMFNEEWRDLLLAFIQSLKNETDQVSINTNTEIPIILKNCVETYYSEFGYHDPKDLERQAIFNQEDREETNEEIE